MLARTGSVKRGVVSPDLLEERAKCAFSQEELMNFVHGGDETLSAWKRMMAMFGDDPELRNTLDFYDMTPHEMQENLWKRMLSVYQKHKPEFFLESQFKPPYVDLEVYFQSSLPLTLHISMFRLSIENLANQEQAAFWLPKVKNVDIIGCYAQTELGHGSNVAGLETTATLDKETDEFVIHTPTIAATKYWPGDLGMFASHAVVFARLLIDEQDYGVQPFMVQIRDIDTWKVRPGVKCGDLGPKIGYHGKNNGWASFDQVRIPRTNMLMKLCEVSREGEFSIKGDPRVLYSVMMAIRMQIVQYSGISTMLATQIAVRYCCVRRQFSTLQGVKDERKVIDYQTTAASVAKLIAKGVTQSLAGVWITKQYQLMMSEVNQGVFTRMDQNHHMLSGFKAMFSE